MNEIFLDSEGPGEEKKEEDQMKKLRGIFAEMLSKELMKRGQAVISDEKLYKLVGSTFQCFTC